MQDFNDLNAIRKIDPQDTLGSTELQLKQLRTAWQEVHDLPISENFDPIKSDFADINNIVFCGMGASVYGALVVKALVGPSIPCPIEIISDYHLPKYVGAKTLVVLTSYSGTTEEVLSCADEAKEKNAKMLILTSGGPLSEFAKTNNIPAYIFDGKLNPAGVPRLGNGYTILGLIGLLTKAGIINIEKSQIEKALSSLENKITAIKEKAMKDAQLFFEKVPVIFAAEHLSGNAQILRNQFNETSKTFSSYYLVPDLNHHLMEGLQFPRPSNLYFITINSKNYTPKIQKRMELTRDVLEQNKCEIFEINSSGRDIYEDFLETLSYGSYLTLYLALLHDQNPAINPWVDHFKNKLKE